MNDAPLTILGGGPAGLATAFYARRHGLPFRLFEAADVLGGNARTIWRGPFGFDTGAHRLHDKDPQTTDDLKALLGDDLLRIEVPSQIVDGERRLDFPLAPFDLLKKLPFRTLLRIAGEQLYPTGPRHGRSFRAMALRAYGPTLAHRYLLNYSEKLWGLPTEQLDPAVAGGRLDGLDVRTFLLEALLGNRAATRHLDGAFLYPRRGFGAIADAVASAAGRERMHTGSPITRLYHDGRRVTQIQVDGTHLVDVEGELVSTLPLPLLVRILRPVLPSRVRRLATSVRYRHLRLAVFGLDRPNVSPNASLYFPSRSVPFTRIYEPKNRSRHLAPPSQTAIVVECPAHADDELWTMPEPAFRTLVLQHLQDRDIIAEGEVLWSESRALSHAYPVLERGTPERAERLLDALGFLDNLHLIGRSATFRYTHLHDLFGDARSLVQQLRRKALVSPAA